MRLTLKKIIFNMAFVGMVLDIIPSQAQTYISSPSTTENFVQVVIPNYETTSLSVGSGWSLDANNVDEIVKYYDGLGRLKQTSFVAAGSGFEDIIQPAVYDGWGRVAKEYLPFSIAPQGENVLGTIVPSASVQSVQQAYYNVAAYQRELETGDYQKAFSSSTFDVLNRPTSLTGPGAAWHNGNKKTTITYGSNVANEVPRCRATYTTFSSPCEGHTAFGNETTFFITAQDDDSDDVWVPAFYAPGQLLVKATVDEDGHQVKEYIDKKGLLIMKKAYITTTQQANTLYIYDRNDQLILVVTPKAFSAFTASINGWYSCDPIVKELCYYYEYDHRHRMVMKRLPGAEPVHFIYDNADLIRMSRDGNQAVAGTWAFTKYDAQNRPVITGVLPGPMTLANMQSFASGVSARESWTGSGPLHGYTNIAFPTTTFTATGEGPALAPAHVNTVNYYDQYNFTSKTYVNPNATYFSAYDPNVRGKLTGTIERVLKPASPAITIVDDMLESAIFYDKKGRVIQTVTDNIHGGIERVTNQYDFIGNVLRTWVKNEIPGKPTVEVRKRFVYDNQSRLVEVYNQFVGQGGEILTSQYTYDDLGVRTQTNLHKKMSGQFSQSVDYRYNIRGWLTSINDPLVAKQSGDYADDLFRMKLEYHKWNTLISVFDLDGSEEYFESLYRSYNGNISAATSITSGGDDLGFIYEYDGLNRLKGAYNDEDWSPKDRILTYEYCLYSYDLNGNFTELDRNIQKPGSYIFDEINYKYYPITGTTVTSNKLKNAFEDGDPNTGYKSTLSSSATQFTYDANGNMKTDAAKGITNIEYNVLNLPATVQIGGVSQVQYFYSATGSKLVKCETVDSPIVPIIRTAWYTMRVKYCNIPRQRKAGSGEPPTTSTPSPTTWAMPA